MKTEKSIQDLFKGYKYRIDSLLIFYQALKQQDYEFAKSSLYDSFNINSCGFSELEEGISNLFFVEKTEYLERIYSLIYRFIYTIAEGKKEFNSNNNNVSQIEINDDYLFSEDEELIYQQVDCIEFVLYCDVNKGEKEIYILDSSIINQWMDTELDNAMASLNFLLNKKAPLSITISNEAKKQAEYNSNYFNENCYCLFNYLENNYEKKGKVKYINIFYFLKEMSKESKDKYRFTMRIEDYKKLIEETQGIIITKFKKAEYQYDDDELPILKELEYNYRKLQI